MTNQKNGQRTVQICDIKGNYHTVHEETVIADAQQCINQRFQSGESLTSTDKAKDFIKILIGNSEHEIFYVVFLNNQHEVIQAGPMFRGTIDGSAVYPREVVKEGLACNAAAVIFAHNHPSGTSDPSQADINITNKLKSALDIVDIRLLDHFVIGATTTSFASSGLL